MRCRCAGGGAPAQRGGGPGAGPGAGQPGARRHAIEAGRRAALAARRARAVCARRTGRRGWQAAAAPARCARLRRRVRGAGRLAFARRGGAAKLRPRTGCARAPRRASAELQHTHAAHTHIRHTQCSNAAQRAAGSLAGAAWRRCALEDFCGAGRAVRGEAGRALACAAQQKLRGGVSKVPMPPTDTFSTAGGALGRRSASKGVATPRAARGGPRRGGAAGTRPSTAPVRFGRGAVLVHVQGGLGAPRARRAAGWRPPMRLMAPGSWRILRQFPHCRQRISEPGAPCGTKPCRLSATEPAQGRNLASGPVESLQVLSACVVAAATPQRQPRCNLCRRRFSLWILSRRPPRPALQRSPKRATH